MDQITSFRCPICGKVYNSEYDAEKHVSTHIPNDNTEKEYIICGKKFNRKDHLVRHYRSHMTPCPQCNKTFSNQKMLDNHMKAKHSNMKCKICDKSFINVGNLNRHMKTHNPTIEKRYKCDICGKEYKSQNYYDKHMDTHTEMDIEPIPSTSNSTLDETYGKKSQKKKVGKKHPNPDRIVVRFECTTCGETFPNITSLREHLKEYDHMTETNAIQEEYFQNHNKKGLRNNFGQSTTLTAGDVQEALGGVLKVVKFLPLGEQEDDMTIFLGHIRDDILKYISNEITNRVSGVKWHLIYTVEFVKIASGDQDKNGPTDHDLVYSERYLHSHARIALVGDTEDMMKDAMKQAYYDMNTFMQKHEQGEGTGWYFHRVIQCRLFMGTYRPLNASNFIPLPYPIMCTKSVLNIKNYDNKCFIWCIVAHLYPIDGPNANRVNNYVQWEKNLNMTGIEFPVTVADIVKFEKNNRNISVNVFGVEDIMNEGENEHITYYPLYLSKCQSSERNHVNLLVIEKEDRHHYCLIRNLNRMLASQNKHKGQTYFCTNCLHGFCKKELLDRHIPLCTTHDPLTIKMPEGDEAIMTFKAVDKMLKVPYVIYADFECILKPISEEEINERNSTSQKRKNEHVPCGYAFLVVCSDIDSQQHSVVTYSGENGLENFFEDIITVTNDLMQSLKCKIDIIMTEEDELDYEINNVCHICGKFINTLDKVRDHCHLSGKYRGPAHNECNLQYKFKKFIPIFFHNLEGYDSHILMQELGKYKNFKVSCIPKNMEKYISFSLGCIRFLDSLNFMNESLAKLVSNLSASGYDNFYHINRHFPIPTQRYLLMRKGVYPYEWMDSIEKMNNTELPPKRCIL